MLPAHEKLLWYGRKEYPRTDSIEHCQFSKYTSMAQAQREVRVADIVGDSSMLISQGSIHTCTYRPSARIGVYMNWRYWSLCMLQPLS